MLAILYLVAATCFGDLICRRFYRFISLQQRLATSFLVGLLFSTWITFLSALLFSRMRQPLIAANLVFLLIFATVWFWSRRYRAPQVTREALARPAGSLHWDLIWMVGFLIVACWLMFATLSFKDGQFQIAFKAWTDFGANISLTQSFALGHNFPPQHPFFPGEFIRYHFLFWFQTANLEFLGLSPVWSINILSILSLLALLTLIMTFAEILFNSRTVGRLSAVLFFFSSSLSYLSFLRSQNSISGTINSIVHRTDFLASGYPFRGETWGVLSANVFAYQRHLISGIGLLLVALVFIIDRYRQWFANQKDKSPEEISIVRPPNQSESERQTTIVKSDYTEPLPVKVESGKPTLIDLKAWILSGVLIGLLPYWNSPTYLAALAICGCALLVLPLRLYLATVIAAAIIVGLPQALLLRSGNVLTYSLLHWGYTLEQPSLFLILKYLGWTFGVKWILLGVAVVLASGFQRRLFVALSILLVIVFLFQLSTDIFNNHKLLNIWATVVNVYAAYALWRISKQKIAGMGLAIVLAVATVFGGLIDLFPLHNDPMLSVAYQNDRLTNWLLANTHPSDVFLTHTLLTHQILFAGRKIYLGYTLFAWTAGYNVPERETLYRQMFQESDGPTLTRLLRANNISYVAIDDGVRHNETLPDLNEWLYEERFEKVFEDTAHVYDNVVIYKVP